MVGVSADKPETQLKFVEKFGLTFPMVPNPTKEIIDAWGARKVNAITAQRSTFLVDPNGHIAAVWPKVNLIGHADDVVRTIERFSKE